jgi:hypothetical protein
MMADGGIKGIAPLILNISKASGQCHTICFGENNLTTNCTEGWMGYTASLDTLKKRKILVPARDSTILLRRLA